MHPASPRVCALGAAVVATAIIAAGQAAASGTLESLADSHDVKMHWPALKKAALSEDSDNSASLISGLASDRRLAPHWNWKKPVPRRPGAGQPHLDRRMPRR
jgi:hypothetical protein